MSKPQTRRESFYKTSLDELGIVWRPNRRGTVRMRRRMKRWLSKVRRRFDAET